MAVVRRVWKWGDLAVAAATVVVAIALWGSPHGPRERPPVPISSPSFGRQGGVEQVFALNADDPGTERAVQSEGYHYVLRFEGGRVRVLTADCPDKVCVVTGWLSKPGQMAACVPGRLLVRIEASSSQGTGDPGVDAVSQ